MTTLTFQNTTLSVQIHNNQSFFTASDLGRALDYSDADRSVRRLYTANADEFTPEMTALVEMQTAGGKQQVRIFSLRGAHLIAMFARTKVAKDFRKWVLDIIDREISQNQPQIAPLVEPTYTLELKETEIRQFIWLHYSHRRMMDILGWIAKGLEVIGSKFAAEAYGCSTEYKRHNDKTKPVLERLIAQIDDKGTRQELTHRLTATV